MLENERRTHPLPPGGSVRLEIAPRLRTRYQRVR
jgi:hypothetical protein